MGEVAMKVAGRVAGGCVVLSPSHPDVLTLRRPASASWVLREAKQVAPTTRLAGPEPSKSRCALPGSRSAPPTPTATGRNAVEAPQTRLYAPRWAPVAFPEQRVTRGHMRCHPQILFDAEEPFRVLGRCVFDLLDGEGVEVGKLFGDVADVDGLVALAAVRDRCEVWGVCLHEDAVQGDRLGDVAQHHRVLEGDD